MTASSNTANCENSNMVSQRKVRRKSAICYALLSLTLCTLILAFCPCLDMAAWLPVASLHPPLVN